MRYAIEAREGYIRGEIIERETPEETREFCDAVQAAMREKGIHRALIVVRASRPIFRVEEYQLSELLKRFVEMPGGRVAREADERRSTRHALIARRRATLRWRSPL